MSNEVEQFQRLKEQGAEVGMTAASAFLTGIQAGAEIAKMAMALGVEEIKIKAVQPELERLVREKASILQMVADSKEPALVAYWQQRDRIVDVQINGLLEAIGAKAAEQSDNSGKPYLRDGRRFKAVAGN